MNEPLKPAHRPACTHFSSGPCAKRPGWSSQVLENAVVGRSHRAKDGKARLKLAIDKSKAILGIPEDYLVGIVPGSDTGAFELAMWTMLGARGVDVLAWESFGHGWVTDVTKQLKLQDVRVKSADYGKLPELRDVDFDRDVIFTWNGTTSGVRVPNGNWIAADRRGLTLVDATSAVFAQRIDWSKADVTTWSWQKVMGGEAAHGMIALSPRAVERLLAHVPPWPLPKVFRLTSGGKLIKGIFAGETINTPSMLCVEDYLDALAWAERIGGIDAVMARADANAKVLNDWVERTPWIANLADDPATRSNTSVCLKFVDPSIARAAPDVQARFAKDFAALLEAEGAAMDCGSYRDAPPGLRIWTGSTVEVGDVEALLPWLDWAFAQTKARLAEAA